jgi:cytochrome P450
VTPDDVDLSDLNLFAAGAPWEAFRVLREKDPVHWNPEPSPNHGFWAVTQHDDIVRVGRDDQTYSSEIGAVNLEELDADQLEMRKSMLETDGARHWALRRLLQREFTARSLAGYETFLRGLTATTLDAAFAQGDFDFVKAVSADYPIRVLVRLMDVPDEMGDQFIKWSNRLVGNTDPDYADVLLESEESQQYRDLPFRSPAALEVFAYGDSLARDRAGGDGVDLVSKLVNQVPEDGVPLSERDFHTYFLLLVAAGNETTRHTLSHTMRALIEHPEAMAELRANPDLLPVAVEEFLRWATPVYHFRRTATRDHELGGVTIREGDKVVMWYASGNRDEAIFEQPDRFDIHRTNNDHVTFGKGGPHFCLGNQLARLEVRIMIEEILRRDVKVDLTGPIEHVRSNFIHGIKRFPVRVSSR